MAIDGLYDALADAGLGYGPAFPEACAGSGGDPATCSPRSPWPNRPTGFGVHPALLDAALHAIGAGRLLPGETTDVRLPFAFSSVRLLAPSGSLLRVRLSLAEGTDTIRLAAADDSGLPVLNIDRLALRTVSAAQLSASAGSIGRGLLELQWQQQPLDAVTTTPTGWDVVRPGDELPNHETSLLVLDSTGPVPAEAAAIPGTNGGRAGHRPGLARRPAPGSR